MNLKFNIVDDAVDILRDKGVDEEVVQRVLDDFEKNLAEILGKSFAEKRPTTKPYSIEALLLLFIRGVE